MAGSGPTSTLPAIVYKPGWRFRLGGPLNSMLCITAETIDSQRQDRTRLTQHQFTIPDGLDDEGFARWLLDRLLLCERHEACEFLVVDGRAPFFPHHGDEGSPYELVERF